MEKCERLQLYRGWRPSTALNEMTLGAPNQLIPIFQR
jgi:hypothetical protein